MSLLLCRSTANADRAPDAAVPGNSSWPYRTSYELLSLNRGVGHSVARSSLQSQSFASPVSRSSLPLAPPLVRLLYVPEEAPAATSLSSSRFCRAPHGTLSKFRSSQIPPPDEEGTPERSEGGEVTELKHC